MADNTPFTADPAQIIATDDVGGIKFQRVKVSLGVDGSAVDAVGNLDGTALVSAARTTTTNSADLLNYNGRGVHVVLDVTAGAALSLTLSIQGLDLASGKYYKLNADPTAVTGTGTTVYELYPGGLGAASGGVTQRTAASVPHSWRVLVTHGNATSTTYTVGYSIIL